MKRNKSNKAIYSILNSLLHQGFCVNEAGFLTSYGWTCQRDQATWSNSRWNGITGNTTKSKGTPSWKSNAGVAASAMAGATPATGNPTETKNYLLNYKWGKDMATKWTAGNGSSDEKGNRYEGEEAVSKPYLSICSKRLSALIFTYYINKIREKQDRKTFKTFNFRGFETPSE